MVIIFGLGNPGKKYIGTRHNIGQEVVNLLQKKEGFSEWQKKKKLKAEISKGEVGDKEVILAKSLSFMNESGIAVKRLITNYELRITNLWIIQDEVDLPLGKIKIVKNRSSAGHKGVESIIRELGTKNLIRFRIGIARFAGDQKSKIKNQKSKIQKLDKFVLKKFTKDEKKIVKEVINKTIEAVEMALKEGMEGAMQKFNK